MLRALAVVTALLAPALLLLAGCRIGDGTGGAGGSGSRSRSVSCVNDRCRIEVAGDQSGSRLGVLGRELRIEEIDEGAVTLTVGGERARVVAGQAQPVAGLDLQVRSAGAGRATLDVRRTPN